MLFKIVDTVTHEVILDHFMSYEEAWTAYSHLPNDDTNIKLEIEEYKIPIKRMGRDPALH